MKSLDDKKLVMIGIRRRGKWGFNIKLKPENQEQNITQESKFNKEDIHQKAKSS